VYIIMIEGKWVRMSNNNVDSNKNNPFQNNNYLIWLLVYMGIGLAISFIIPFPISLGVLLLAFVLINVIRTDRALRKQGIDGIKGLYKSMSPSFANRSNGLDAGGLGYTAIKFYCMNCGHEHRNDACPKCGSKAVKVG
jgi:hypothetical protein